jgi:Raf kinase inhibitor-like YbhB/YbcL family protein
MLHLPRGEERCPYRQQIFGLSKRKKGIAMSLELKTTAFTNGSEIPRKYTCSGTDLSPALTWSGVSPAARSLALIADDPDAPRGTWTHWLIWNIPAHLTSLPEGVPPREVLDNGASQGRNDFNRIGYGGPCPPPGKAHRYFFKLYALNTVLDLRAGAGRKELERAMKGHIVSEADWMGTYKR